MSEGLDPSWRPAAYVCGRLMAEFDTCNEPPAKPKSTLRCSTGTLLWLDLPGRRLSEIESLRGSISASSGATSQGCYAIDARLRDLHGLLQPSASGAFPAKLAFPIKDFLHSVTTSEAWSIAQARDRKQI